SPLLGIKIATRLRAQIFDHGDRIEACQRAPAKPKVASFIQRHILRVKCVRTELWKACADHLALEVIEDQVELPYEQRMSGPLWQDHFFRSILRNRRLAPASPIRGQPPGARLEEQPVLAR